MNIPPILNNFLCQGPASLSTPFQRFLSNVAVNFSFRNQKTKYWHLWSWVAQFLFLNLPVPLLPLLSSWSSSDFPDFQSVPCQCPLPFLLLSHSLGKTKHWGGVPGLPSPSLCLQPHVNPDTAWPFSLPHELAFLLITIFISNLPSPKTSGPFHAISKCAPSPISQRKWKPAEGNAFKFWPVPCLNYILHALCPPTLRTKGKCVHYSIKNESQTLD